MTLKRTPVTSSNIRSIGFDPALREMHIEFASGRVYAYTGPKVEEHYNALVKADSIGKHFAAHVRGCPETKARAL